MEHRGHRLHRLLLLIPFVTLTGCNPYVAAISVARVTYGTATDLRALSTQESDTEIELKLKPLFSPLR